MGLEGIQQLTYAKNVTLLQRNRMFVAVISISAVIFILILLATIISMFFSSLLAEADISAATRRALNFIQPLMNHFPGPSIYVPFISMLGTAFYSLIVLILIFYFFEKTQSPEIIFFALFVFSFSAEALRCVVFFTNVFRLSPVYPVISARILFFGRYFGIFCLFAASVCAAGFKMQKQETIILVAIIVALSIAIGIPLDSFSWDTSFTIIYGYNPMYILAESAIGIITALSFFIAAHSRGTKEYIFIGVSVVFILVGRNILLNADTWVTLPIGVFLLGIGSWFACAQIHRIYLWL